VIAWASSSDLDPELVIELHDQLDQVERVSSRSSWNESLISDLVIVDAELLTRTAFTARNFFSRRCHVTSSFGADFCG
jgi:hypothetical protein